MRPRDVTIPDRVREHLRAAIADPDTPISVRAVAEALGISPTTLYNHQRWAENAGRPRDRVITRIKRAVRAQERITRRIKRRRGAREEAVQIEQLRAKLQEVQEQYSNLLEKWVLIEMNAARFGMSVDSLLVSLADKPDRSVSQAGRHNRGRTVAFSID